jgi:hypothetical protein
MATVGNLFNSGPVAKPRVSALALASALVQVLARVQVLVPRKA